MRKLSAFLLAVLIGGCATTEMAPIDPESFSQTDISVVLSANFEASEGAAYRALKPSFEKFGNPKRYVSGNMSAVFEGAKDRLYGSGDLHSRFSVSNPVFWQIDGDNLDADVLPIKTVHLIYDKAEFADLTFEQNEMETRRGKTFTVFERVLGSRVIVSIYPTVKLSKSAQLNQIRFQN